MIKGIFNWLKKAVQAKAVEAYDITIAPIGAKDQFAIPEAMADEPGYDMAENYAVNSCATDMTQFYQMGRTEVLIHNVDQRRFVLAHHNDGTILVFEVEDPSTGNFIEVDQMHRGTHLRLSNAKFIARTTNGVDNAEDAKTYDFYTSRLDPAELEIAG